MRLRKIDPSNKKDIRQWVQFPFDLYKTSDLWVPPLIISEKAQLDSKNHPYYKHSTADFYLAEDQNGKTLGRIGLIHNTRYIEYAQDNAGHFGFFEVTEDEKVATALLDTAIEWANQKGFRKLIGPKGLITTENGGVLVDGYEHRPALNVPYNYPYYKDFFENAGFQKERDAFSGHIYIPDATLSERVAKIAERVIERRGFHIKTFNNKAEMRAMVKQAQEVLHRAFQNGFGYVPLTDEEFAYAAEDLITIADPQLIKLVMKGDQIVGFLFAYQDVSAGLQKAQGKLFPFGWYHILRDKKRTKWVNVNGLGILPEYQGLGGNAIMYVEMAKTILSYQFEHCDTVFVGEENYRSFSDNESMGVTWYKTHRMYFKDL